jgi:RUN and FYVE domain-containing protein 1/2
MFKLFLSRYVSESSSLTALKETSQTLSLQVVSCEKRAAQAEGDLRIEREWRSALQEKEMKHKEMINNLQMQIKKFTEDSRVKAHQES